jgi:hypothetical protein
VTIACALVYELRIVNPIQGFRASTRDLARSIEIPKILKARVSSDLDNIKPATPSPWPILKERLHQHLPYQCASSTFALNSIQFLVKTRSF